MPQKCVLSITNVADIQKPIRHILREDGWTTQEASAIADARNRIATGRTDVILTEDNVSDGNWLDILTLAQAVSPRSQVVVVSRIADERLWAEVLSMGGFDLLELPFDREELLRVANAAWRCANTHTKRASA
jgi:DNA-binding NtrC family response regulator